MSKEQTLQKWLKDEVIVPCNQKRRLVIYDFDSTLFKSPERANGEVIYLEKTGELWPHQGWWGRIETLMPPLVPDPIPEEMWVNETLAAYRRDILDEDARLVLMTGRPFKIRHRVEEILDSANIKFHDYYYRGMKGQTSSDTLEIKVNIIEKELIHDLLETLEIYEDRPDHASHFMDLAKKWKSRYGKLLRKIIIHKLPENQHFEF